MTDTEWNEWVKYHATLFGLSTDADSAMMRAWRPLLAGYSAAELTEASGWLALHESARWRTQHADLLSRRIQGRRIEAHHREQEALQAARREDAGCLTCHGSGIVIVPHPKSISGSVWQPPHVTAGIACSCRSGTAFYARVFEASNQPRDGKNRPPPKLMQLEEYELNNPDWRQQLASAAEYQRGIEHARHVARMAHAGGKAIDVAEVRKRLKTIGRMPS